MQLSVIFGTYNRLKCLQRVVASVRESLCVANISYEIVVCDGGSTDGSREWLLAQDDVVLLAKRSLDGAVDAFNLCARAARGDYIANLNDDCVVIGDALAHGVAAMMATPHAGLGVFEMNCDDGWRIVEHRGYAHANFGIVRRALYAQVAHITGGFWASCYRTYAGDTELSLWAVKLGWQVLPLYGMRVQNAPAHDVLRKLNAPDGVTDGQLFATRWRDAAWILPDGAWPDISFDERVRFSMMPQAQGVFSATLFLGDATLPPPVLEPPHLRTLDALDPVDAFPPQKPCTGFERTMHLHLTNTENKQPGLSDALKKISRGGYVCYPWHDDVPKGREYVRDRTLAHIREHKPSLVWMQLQTPFLTPSDMDAFREALPREGLLVTWNGDLSPPNSLSADDLAWQAALYQHVDLALHFTLDHVAKLRAEGVPAAYLQIGYDTEWFYPAAPKLRTEFDTVFFGNVYKSLPGAWAAPRAGAARALQQAFGKRFGLFGFGWDLLKLQSNGAVVHKETASIYRRSLCAVAVSVTDDVRAMSSDRLPRALASGCCVMVKRFLGHEIWGLEDNVNCVLWDTPEELVERTRYMVEHRDEALAIGVAGAKLAVEHHTWDVRMREMQPLLEVVRNNRRR